MSAKVIAFGAAHDDAEMLLPWYVNGTLDADDRERVARHLVECAQCRREVSALTAFRTQYAREDRVSRDERVPDSATAFARMAPMLPGRRPRWHAHVAGWWQSLLRSNRTSRLQRRASHRLRWAVAFAATVAAVTIGAMIAVHDDPLPYRTLSRDNGAVPRGERIVVVFDPRTTEQQLRRIVNTAGARIVDGPTTSDAYVLEVIDGSALNTVRVLRAHAGVVRAEPLQAAR